MEYESSTLEIANRHRAATKKLFQQWFCHYEADRSKAIGKSIDHINDYNIINHDCVCQRSTGSVIPRGVRTTGSFRDNGVSLLSRLQKSGPCLFSDEDSPNLMMLHRSPSGAQKKIRQKREENRTYQQQQQHQQRLSCYSSTDHYNHYQQQSTSATNLPAAVLASDAPVAGYFGGSTNFGVTAQPRSRTTVVDGGELTSAAAVSANGGDRSMVDLHGYRSILPDDSSGGDGGSPDTLAKLAVDRHRRRNEERENHSASWQQISPPSLRFLDSSRNTKAVYRMSSEDDRELEYGGAEAWHNVILRSTAGGSLSRLAAEPAGEPRAARWTRGGPPQSPTSESVGEITTKIGELHNIVGNLIGAHGNNGSSYTHNNNGYYVNSNNNSSSNNNSPGANSNSSSTYFGKPTVQVHPMPATRSAAPSNSPPETLKKPAPPPVPKKPSHMRPQAQSTAAPPPPLPAPPPVMQRHEEVATVSGNKYKVNVIPRSSSASSECAPAVTLWSSKMVACRDNCAPPPAEFPLSKTPSWKRLPNTVSKYRTEVERTLPRNTSGGFGGDSTSTATVVVHHARANSASALGHGGTSNWTTGNINNNSSKLVQNYSSNGYSSGNNNKSSTSSNNSGSGSPTTTMTPCTLGALASIAKTATAAYDLNNNNNNSNGHSNRDDNNYSGSSIDLSGYGQDPFSASAMGASVQRGGSNVSSQTSFSTAAHSYSSSLDGAYSKKAKDSETGGFGAFLLHNNNNNNSSGDKNNKDSNSFIDNSGNSGAIGFQRVNASSQSLLNLHDSLNHAMFNPEEHSYEELVELEKRRHECIVSLTRKIADRETDLATIDEDLESVAQSREALFREFATCSAGQNAILLSRVELHKSEGERLADLEQRLATQLDKLSQSTDDSKQTEVRRRRLEEQLEDTRMIRAAFDAREASLEEELYAAFAAAGTADGEKLLADWRFCNKAVVRLNAERKIVGDALAAVRQQLDALESITVLPRIDAAGASRGSSAASLSSPASSAAESLPPPPAASSGLCD